ncbi:MAG: polyhydroxyalkanoic acid system family protein [Pseudomonadota bacterium]
MGRPVTVTIEHDHGIEGARARIEERFGSLEDSIAGNMGLKFEKAWDGDRLNFTARGMGQKVTGELDVFPNHVRIVVVLPGLLAGMAEALQGKLQKHGQIMLEDKTAPTT